MGASFERFMAWRYLFSRQRRWLASLITLISVGGVGVGVAALILVMGVMDGIDQMIFGKVSELYPHLRIRPASGSEMIIDSQMLQKLRAHPDVLLAEPALQRQTVMQVLDFVSEVPPVIVQLIGVDRISSDGLYPAKIYTHSRFPEKGPIEIQSRQIVLGASIPIAPNAPTKKRLESVILTATNPINTAVAPIAKTMKMRIQGAFETGMYEFDMNTAFVKMEDLRTLFRIPSDHADYIHVKLKDPFKASVVRKAFDFGPEYRIATWAEENSAFFNAIKLEKLGMTIILGLAVLVAAFNIIGTLILIVIEKTREVGMLRALGASERSIARIFIFDGVMIGLIGVTLGVIGGVSLGLLIPMIHFDMPINVTVLNYIPVNLRPISILFVVLGSMLICSVAAIFPALQAAKLNPVEALRHD